MFKFILVVMYMSGGVVEYDIIPMADWKICIEKKMEINKINPNTSFCRKLWRDING